MTPKPDFDWIDDAECIVIRSQPAIAFYTNPHGDFVLRQEGQHHPDEDQFIYVTPENLESLGLVLLNAAARGLPVETCKSAKQRRPNGKGNGNADAPLLTFRQAESIEA